MSTFFDPDKMMGLLLTFRECRIISKSWYAASIKSQVLHLLFPEKEKQTIGFSYYILVSLWVCKARAWERGKSTVKNGVRLDILTLMFQKYQESRLTLFAHFCSARMCLFHCRNERFRPLRYLYPLQRRRRSRCPLN